MYRCLKPICLCSKNRIITCWPPFSTIVHQLNSGIRSGYNFFDNFMCNVFIPDHGIQTRFRHGVEIWTYELRCKEGWEVIPHDLGYLQSDEATVDKSVRSHLISIKGFAYMSYAYKTCKVLPVMSTVLKASLGSRTRTPVVISLFFTSVNGLWGSWYNYQI